MPLLALGQGVTGLLRGLLLGQQAFERLRVGAGAAGDVFAQLGCLHSGVGQVANVQQVVKQRINQNFRR